MMIVLASEDKPVSNEGPTFQQVSYEYTCVGDAVPCFKDEMQEVEQAE